MEFANYSLVGIGEFSHGIEEIWDFRYKLLCHAVKNTTHKIFIFNEMSVWQADNLMNGTIVVPNTDRTITHKNIKIERPIDGLKIAPSWGCLWQYVGHTSESKIFYKIIKYIRKHIDRIELVGIDNDTLSRDYDMYQNIINRINLQDNQNINFFWAHNYHVDSRKMSWDNYKYTKDEHPNLTHTCGYYLKKLLKDKYCIILSQAYQGINRFNGYCKGDACKTREWLMKYFYKSFKYAPNKKYTIKQTSGTRQNNKKSFQMLDKFDNRLIEFSNSFYSKHKDGHQDKVDSQTWDFILFWDKVSYLEPFCTYG
jgi:hypothetical protein